MSTGSRKSYGITGPIDRQYVIGEVVNVDDPEQAGRAQIRVVGYQGDKGLIKDQDLHWGRPIFPVSNPMNGGIGGPATGLMKGSHVWCQYADADGQQLMIVGSIAKSGKSKGPDAKPDYSGRGPDNPKAARDPTVEGGDYRMKPNPGDGGESEYDQKSITEYSTDEATNPYGDDKAKESGDDAFSLANEAFEV